MPTSNATFFDVFSENLAEGVHAFHAAGHQLGIYLSNATPSVSADSLKADLAEIATGTDYLGFANAQTDTQNDTSRSGDTTTVTCVASITITAATPDVAQFRYVALANNTATSDPLILWWDYGSALDLAADDEFVWTPTGSALMTIAPA